MGLFSGCVLESGLLTTGAQRFLQTDNENSRGQFGNRDAFLCSQLANILLIGLYSFGFIMMQGFEIDYSGGAI